MDIALLQLYSKEKKKVRKIEIEKEKENYDNCMRVRCGGEQIRSDLWPLPHFILNEIVPQGHVFR
jgi:hypothetical protein